jgi:protein SDA1
LTLFNIEDKELRGVLYKYILNDIRRMNRHHKNVKINQEIRSFIYGYIVKNADKMAQKALQLMIELYKKNVWTDNRSVNIIAEGCFSQSAKIRMIAAHFLIATTEALEELSESEDEPTNPSEIKMQKGVTKHTKSKERQMEKEKRRAARRLRKKEIQGRRQNFMPIDVIYNPQIFAEKLFNFMSKKNIKFSHKLIFMALVARLIWRHKLIILPWYGSLVKYMEPKQKEVHKVLTYFAESVHDSLPDDDIETVLKHIIEKFVNDRCTEFAMTIGLNTIREVYAKLNSIIKEEDMLYLASYYEYKNKNVRMAAKALINLVRDVNPDLLEKKYRGRVNGDGSSSQRAGREGAKTDIEGAELLEHKGDLPVYYDRVLTDEDFKQIRKLKRRKEEEKEWEEINKMEDEGE